MKQFIFIVYAALLLQCAFCKDMTFDSFKVKLHGVNDVSKNLKYPETMDKITLSNMDTLEITFKLVEKENQDEPISKIEQAMIYLSNDKSENSFIVNALEGGQYKVSLKDLSIDNGDYNLIVRLSSPTKDYTPLQYDIGKAKINYTIEEKKPDPLKAPTILESEGPNFYPKPDQPHIFKPDPKPKSKLFAKFVFLIMLLPWAFLIFAWSKIGVNINGLFYNNKTMIYGVLFIASLCSIICILTLFFIKLNLFQTLYALGVASIYTFVLGHLVLRQKAEKRSNERKSKKSSSKSSSTLKKETEKEKDTKTN